MPWNKERQQTNNYIIERKYQVTVTNLTLTSNSISMFKIVHCNVMLINKIFAYVNIIAVVFFNLK